MTAVSYGFNRIISADTDVSFVPKFGPHGRRGIVVLPGQLQTPLDYVSDANPNQQTFFRELMRTGTAGAVIDATVAGWGSDLTGHDAVGAIETTRIYLSNLGCATDKIVLVGASAGVTDALNYTRTYPSKVAALIGIMPAVDLDDIRDNNRGSARANINTAWGMTVGSTSATEALPSRANPNTTTNAASIASSGAPVGLYYSTADTIVIASTVTSFASKLGVTPTVISTSVDHSDALFGLVDMDEVVDLIAAEV